MRHLAGRDREADQARLRRGVAVAPPSRSSAAQQGGANNKCLIALVPGVHPVYFYDDFADSMLQNQSDIKRHDLFELK